MCGSGVQTSDLSLHVVPPNALDEPSAMAPTDHIWMSDAASWDRPGDGLPQHAGWRSAP